MLRVAPGRRALRLFVDRHGRLAVSRQTPARFLHSSPVAWHWGDPPLSGPPAAPGAARPASAAWRAAESQAASPPETLARQKKALGALHTLLAGNWEATEALMDRVSLSLEEGYCLHLLSHPGFSVDKVADVPALAAHVRESLAKLVRRAEATTDKQLARLTKTQEDLRRSIGELLDGLKEPLSPADIVRQRVIRTVRAESWTFHDGAVVTSFGASGVPMRAAGELLNRLAKPGGDILVPLRSRILCARHLVPATGERRAPARLLDMLNQSHCPLLLGDSGSGKTFAALQLVSGWGCHFAVVHACDSLVGVDGRLRSHRHKWTDQVGNATSEEVARSAYENARRTEVRVIAAEFSGAIESELLKLLGDEQLKEMRSADGEKVRIALIADELGGVPYVLAALVTSMSDVTAEIAKRFNGRIEVRVVGAGTGTEPPAFAACSRGAKYDCAVLQPLNKACVKNMLGGALFDAVASSKSPARDAALALSTNPRGAILFRAACHDPCAAMRSMVPELRNIEHSFFATAPARGGLAAPGDHTAGAASCSGSPDFRVVKRRAFDAAVDGAVLAAAAAFRFLNGLRSRSAEQRMSLLGLAIYVSGCSKSRAAEDRESDGELSAVISDESWKDALVRSTGLLAPDENGVWHLPPAQAVALATDTLQVPWFDSDGESAEAAVAASVWLKLQALAMIDLRVLGDRRKAADADEAKKGLAAIQLATLRMLLGGRAAAGRGDAGGSPLVGTLLITSRKRRFCLTKKSETATQIATRLAADWRATRDAIAELCRAESGRGGDHGRTAIVMLNGRGAPAADVFVIVPSLKVAWAVQVKSYAFENLGALTQDKLVPEVKKMAMLHLALQEHGYEVRMSLCVVAAPSASRSAPSAPASKIQEALDAAVAEAFEDDLFKRTSSRPGCDLTLVGVEQHTGLPQSAATPLWPVMVPLHGARAAGQH